MYELGRMGCETSPLYTPTVTCVVPIDIIRHLSPVSLLRPGHSKMSMKFKSMPSLGDAMRMSGWKSKGSEGT